MLQKIEIERLRSYMKVNAVTFKGMVDDDFVKEKLTIQLEAQLYTMTRQRGTFKIKTQPPSFLDWLFGRRKTIEVDYSIKELVNTKRIRNFPDNISTIQIDIPDHLN